MRVAPLQQHIRLGAHNKEGWAKREHDTVNSVGHFILVALRPLGIEAV
jgi:hypothetical protein